MGVIKRTWIGPWEQWWWNGLNGPQWEWQRPYEVLEGHGGGIASVSPEGAYKEAEGFFITIARPRKEWKERERALWNP